MTYTSHGHHIPGSPEDEGDAPPEARCGGPGLCALCSEQSATWTEAASRASVIADLDSAAPQHQGILIPHEFESVPVRIKAIQFLGGAANGLDIQDWVRSYGGNATWRNGAEPWTAPDGLTGHDGWPETLTIETIDGSFPEAKPGWWIIQGTQGEFYPCRDDVFKEKYKQIVDDTTTSKDQ